LGRCTGEFIVWIRGKLTTCKVRLPRLYSPHFLRITLFTFSACAITIITSEAIIILKKIPFYKTLKSKLERFPAFQVFQGTKLYGIWKGMPAATKVAATITLLNMPPVLMWVNEAWRPWINEHFKHSIYSRNLHTLLLSNFCHDLSGLYIYMRYVDMKTRKLVPQIGAERFLALYICSGIIGRYLQHMWDLCFLDEAYFRFGSNPSIAALFCFDYNLRSDPKEKFKVQSSFLGSTFLFVLNEYLQRTQSFSLIAIYVGAKVGSIYFQWLRYRNLIIR